MKGTAAERGERMIETIREKAARGVTARMREMASARNLRRLARWAGQAAALMALTGSRTLGDLSPFAMACFAAGLAADWSPAAMAAGCALYGWLARWPVQAVTALAGCAVALAGKRLETRLRRDRPAMPREVSAGFEAGAAVLLPGLAASGGLPYNILAAALSAAVAALLAPALIGALSLSGRRKRLLPDERLSCALFAMTLLIGLGSLPFCGAEAAEAAAVLLTLIMASRGPAQGALGGIACGAALALGSGVAPAGSALGLSGLLAGCARLLPRPAAALALALGNGLALTGGIGFTLGGVGPVPLLVGAAVYCALPARRLRRLGRLMEETKPRCDPERLAQRLRRETAERLERLARAFDVMAQGCAGEERQPDEADMIGRMREALCAGCADYARCWQGDHPEAGRLMCRLLSEAVCRGEAPPVSERPPEAVRHCRRSGQIDRRLQPLLSALAEECRARRQRNGLKAVLSRELAEAARALDDMARPLSRPAVMNPEAARLAAAALDRAGLRVGQVTACEESGLQICVALKEDAWTAGTARLAAAALETELAARFACPARPGASDYELWFRQAPALSVRAHAGALPARPGDPCGDAVYTGLLPDGRLAVMLSDGMGSGENAAAESRRTVSLLRTFLEAGLSSAGTLECVNALLQTRGRGELFATVDLCVIDLNSGEACAIKLGACPSLLIRSGRTVDIAGGQLPIGILDSISPGEQRFAVSPGDTLILYTDGIADDLREGQRDWLARAALERLALAPEEMASALLRAAVGQHGRQDDMSVVVIRVEKGR